MARNRATKNAINVLSQAVKATPHRVRGFEFILDVPSQEPKLEVFPLKEGMPRVNGFLYVDGAGGCYGEQVAPILD